MMADNMATEPTERNNTRFNNIFVSFRIPWLFEKYCHPA
jgi:hypothetical protein